MPRVFFGIPASNRELSTALRSLDGEREIRPVRAEGLHLTLRFIGTVDDALCASLVDALSCLDAPTAFDLSLRGFASFSERILFAGAPMNASLSRLLAVTDALLDRMVDDEGQLAGAKAERAARTYTPHVTLARSRSATGQARIAALCVENAERDLGVIEANTLALFASESVPGDANRYVPIASAALLSR